jgi:hypothetical protein
MDIRKYRTDVKAELEGVWLPVGDAKFLIARHNNARYQAAWRRHMRPHWDAGTETFKQLPADEAIRITCDTLAETILLGWEGVTEGGEPVPYSKEKALEYLMDPAMHDFRELIVEASQDQARYRDRQLEAAAKN